MPGGSVFSAEDWPKYQAPMQIETWDCTDGGDGMSSTGRKALADAPAPAIRGEENQVEAALDRLADSLAARITDRLNREPPSEG